MPAGGVIQHPPELHRRVCQARERGDREKPVPRAGARSGLGRRIHREPADRRAREREDGERDHGRPRGAADRTVDADGESGARQAERDRRHPVADPKRGDAVLADGIANGGEARRLQVKPGEACDGRRDSDQADTRRCDFAHGDPGSALDNVGRGPLRRRPPQSLSPLALGPCARSRAGRSPRRSLDHHCLPPPVDGREVADSETAAGAQRDHPGKTRPRRSDPAELRPGRIAHPDGRDRGERYTNVAPEGSPSLSSGLSERQGSRRRRADRPSRLHRRC